MLPPILSETAPHVGDHTKARLRIEAEATYRAAGVHTIVLCAGDYLDDAVAGNWFDSHIASKAHKGRITYPGRTDLPHAWAWLPDLARAVVMLAERRATLAKFQEVCFSGYTLTGEELITAAETAVGHPRKKGPFPWWALSLIGLSIRSYVRLRRCVIFGIVLIRSTAFFCEIASRVFRNAPANRLGAGSFCLRN